MSSTSYENLIRLSRSTPKRTIAEWRSRTLTNRAKKNWIDRLRRRMRGSNVS